jgi:hypothetical protein
MRKDGWLCSVQSQLNYLYFVLEGRKDMPRNARVVANGYSLKRTNPSEPHSHTAHTSQAYSCHANPGTSRSYQADARTAHSRTAHSRTAHSRTAHSRTAHAPTAHSRTAHSRTAHSRTTYSHQAHTHQTFAVITYTSTNSSIAESHITHTGAWQNV